MRRSSVEKLCFLLVALCIPASLLVVYYPTRAALVRFETDRPRLYHLLKDLWPHFPAWPQMFAVQTLAALLLVCGAFYVVSRGDRWFRLPRWNWRCAFPLLVAGYALWCLLSISWSPWRYGTRAYVFRELPFYFIAAMAMLFAARRGRWMVMAGLLVVTALAAAIMQISLVLARAAPRMSIGAWCRAQPWSFGVAFFLAITFGVVALGALVSYWLWDEEENRDRVRLAFAISLGLTALSVIWLLIGLDGGARDLLRKATHMAVFEEPKPDYHDLLRNAFKANPLFFGNVNFAIGIILTAIHITVAFCVARIAAFWRALRQWQRADDVPDGARAQRDEGAVRKVPPELVNEPLTALMLFLALIALTALGFLFSIIGSLAGRIALLVSGYGLIVALVPARHARIVTAVPMALGVVGAPVAVLYALSGAGSSAGPSVIPAAFASAVCAGGLVLCFPAARTKARAALLPLGAGLLMGLFVLAYGIRYEEAGDEMWKKLTGEKSTQHLRVIYWWTTARMFALRPVAGWGAGTFPVVYPRYRPELASKLRFTRWVRPTCPHNEYARVLSELGLIGMVLYAGVLGFAFAVSYRSLSRAPPALRTIGYGVWAGAIAYAVHAAFGKAPMAWMFGANFWVLMGMLAATSWWIGEPPPGPDPNEGIRPKPGERVCLKPDGAVALLIVAVFAGWAWFVWGCGSYASMTAMWKAAAARRAMSEKSVAWLRFAQLRHHVEEERPRCLWPTEVSYHDYAVPWFLADNHCTTEADGPLEALQAVAPDLLKTPMLLSRCYADAGRMADAWRLGTQYILKKPYDMEGYKELAAFDLPGATDLLEKHKKRFEKPILPLAGKVLALVKKAVTAGPLTSEEQQEIAGLNREIRAHERHPNNPRRELAEFYLRLDEARPMLTDPEGYLAAHPYDLAAHRLVELRAELARSDPDSHQDWGPNLQRFMDMDLKAAAADELKHYLDYHSGQFPAYRLLAKADKPLALKRLHSYMDAELRDSSAHLAVFTSVSAAAAGRQLNELTKAYRLLAELDPAAAVEGLTDLVARMSAESAVRAEALRPLPLPGTFAGLTNMLHDPRLDALIARADLRPKETRVRLAQLRNHQDALITLTLDLAAAHLAVKDNDAAEKLALSMQKVDDTNLRVYELLAEVDLTAAITALSKMVARTARAPADHYLSPRAARFLELDAARQRGTRLPRKFVLEARVGAETAAYFFLLARLHLKDGHEEQAAENARAAQSLAPGRMDIYRLLSEADPSRACGLLGTYVNHRDRLGEGELDFWLRKRRARLELADALHCAGREEDAIEQLHLAWALEPQDMATYRAMHRLDPDTAIDHLASYVRQDADCMNSRRAALMKAFLPVAPKADREDLRREIDWLCEGLSPLCNPAAVRLLAGYYAEAGRWDELCALVNRAETEQRIAPFVIVLPAAARLEEAGMPEAITRLRVLFPNVFRKVRRTA